MNRPMVGVVIPTYNEAETIERTLRDVMAYVPGLVRIVVSDGGSTDATKKLALTTNMPDGRVIPAWCISPQPGERRSIAESLIMGWHVLIAAGQQLDLIATIDAGGSHDALDLAVMVQVAGVTDPPDLVIGSRFIGGSHYHGRPQRAVLSKLAAGACNWATPGHPPIHDWTSGLRVWQADALRKVSAANFWSKMHGFQIESLGRARALGLSVHEVPIAYTAGRSSFNNKVAWECFLAWNDLLHHSITWRRS